MLQKYKAGFLEECSGNGLPFMQRALAGNPPLVMAKLSGALKTQAATARLTHVTIGGVTPFFACNVFYGQELIFQRSDFANAVEYVVDGWVHGFLANTVKEVYFTYVRVQDQQFDSTPADNYLLAPFCVEQTVGLVAVGVENESLSALPIHFTQGYNYSLGYSVEDPTSIAFTVTPGAGEGLQPCLGDELITRYIRSFNGKTANDQGEINISAPSAECLTIDNKYVGNAGTIALNAHCAPCCRCHDYKDTSDYTRGFVAEYVNAVKKLQELVAKYNSIVGGFTSRITCCETSDTLTPRFRLWPQQNFKLQIQAMAENNTNKRIRMNEMKLVTFVTTRYPISAIDESGITYSMGADQPIAVIPIANASYLYFKNLNPTSNGLNFGIVSQGKIETSVNIASLPVESCSSTGEHPNDVPPCTGYAMMTSGLVIVDPVFRKIVNLLGTPVQINVQLAFSYTGSAPGADPCSGIGERFIANNVVKVASIAPNRASVNPCPSAKASYLTLNDQGGIRIKFSDAIHGTGSLTLVYKRLSEDGWTNLGSGTVSITGTGQTEFSIGNIPTEFDEGTYQLSVQYVGVAAGGLITKCRAVDASDSEVDIPASSFEVGASFTI